MGQWLENIGLIMWLGADLIFERLREAAGGPKRPELETGGRFKPNVCQSGRKIDINVEFIF
jgi:hypothetical protein